MTFGRSLMRSAAARSVEGCLVMIARLNSQCERSFEAKQLTALKPPELPDLSSPIQYQVSATRIRPAPCASMRLPAVSFQKSPFLMVTITSVPAPTLPPALALPPLPRLAPAAATEPPLEPLCPAPACEAPPLFGEPELLVLPAFAEGPAPAVLLGAPALLVAPAPPLSAPALPTLVSACCPQPSNNAAPREQRLESANWFMVARVLSASGQSSW